VIGLAVRRGGDRRLWLRLGAAAVSLAVGLAWPLGLPVGLLVAIDLVLAALVAVEATGRLAAEPGPHAEPGEAAAVPPPAYRSTLEVREAKQP
jgi:hypothetical protein